MQRTCNNAIEKLQRFGLACSGALLLSLIAGCGAEPDAAVQPAVTENATSAPANAATATTTPIAGMPAVSCEGEGASACCAAETPVPAADTTTAITHDATTEKDPSPHGAMCLDEGACGVSNPAPAPAAATTTAIAAPATTVSSDGLGEESCCAAQPAAALTASKLDGPQMTAGSCCAVPPPEAQADAAQPAQSADPVAAAKAPANAATTAVAVAKPAAATSAVQPQANPHADEAPMDGCASCGGR